MRLKSQKKQGDFVYIIGQVILLTQFLCYNNNDNLCPILIAYHCGI